MCSDTGVHATQVLSVCHGTVFSTTRCAFDARDSQLCTGNTGRGVSTSRRFGNEECLVNVRASKSRFSRGKDVNRKLCNRYQLLQAPGVTRGPTATGRDLSLSVLLPRRGFVNCNAQSSPKLLYSRKHYKLRFYLRILELLLLSVVRLG